MVHAESDAVNNYKIKLRVKANLVLLRGVSARVRGLAEKPQGGRHQFSRDLRPFRVKVFSATPRQDPSIRWFRRGASDVRLRIHHQRSSIGSYLLFVSGLSDRALVLFLFRDPCQELFCRELFRKLLPWFPPRGCEERASRQSRGAGKLLEKMQPQVTAGGK